ncbi:hypothetical protein BECAL_01796 [Bellilinea caldifistulae]|uniref:Uncharacterized protein n=2 Tax=Bellilinea caldifistulae TaxID=360411 RepID=A0A0P6X206_9CHLR|nr:hypothetical protein [Bellilinea caldifistulae]KPL74985.1 hypothetical protein AC812_10755 [Bellilinea caldifistulae]GAP10623.1 hypothetical protein BECAL_01796 [Bellilinea caldifistulae]
MNNLQNALAKLIKHKQDILTAYPARLGDGSGKVIAGAGLVYVRVDDSVTIAACTNVPPIHDLNVWVGYDQFQTSLLRVLGQRDITGKQDFAPGVSAHATMHEFMGAGSLGGTDVIKVQLQQFMPLAVWPYQQLKVIVYPGVVWIDNQYKLIADTNQYGKPVPKVIDFTEYPAPAVNKEMYYLIGIDNTGNIQVVGGTQVDWGTITLNDIPDIPSVMRYPLAAVRRTNEQDAIVMNRESSDIVDLRFPLAHKHTENDLPNNALKIGGYPVDVSGLTVGNTLVFDGTKFAPGDAVGGGGGIHWYVDGHLESSSVIVRSYVAPRDMTIRKIFMMLEQLGTSGTTTIDIRKNGTTIFTNPTSKPSLAYNASNSVTSAVSEVTSVSEGDILTLHLDSAAIGAEGLNVVIDTSSGGGGSVSGFDVGIDAPINWPSSQHNEEFDQSLGSNWTTVNMGSNWYGVANGALIVKLTGVTDENARMVAKPIPSGNWVCYAKVGLVSPTYGSVSNFVSVGIGLYDQNSGRFGLLMNQRNTSAIELCFQLWSSSSAWASSVFSETNVQYFHPYLMMAKKSSGWDFGFSYDGAAFATFLSGYNLTYLTPTHIGMFVQNRVGNRQSAHTMHWMRFEIL